MRQTAKAIPAIKMAPPTPTTTPIMVFLVPVLSPLLVLEPLSLRLGVVEVPAAALLVELAGSGLAVAVTCSVVTAPAGSEVEVVSGATEVVVDVFGGSVVLGGSEVELLLVLVGGIDVVVEDEDDVLVGGTELVVDDGGSEVEDEGSEVDDGGSVDDGDADSVCEAEVWAAWVSLAEVSVADAGAVGEATASRSDSKSLSLMIVPETAAANR